MCIGQLTQHPFTVYPKIDFVTNGVILGRIKWLRDISSWIIIEANSK